MKLNCSCSRRYGHRQKSSLCVSSHPDFSLSTTSSSCRLLRSAMLPQSVRPTRPQAPSPAVGRSVGHLSQQRLFKSGYAGFPNILSKTSLANACHLCGDTDPVSSDRRAHPASQRASSQHVVVARIPHFFGPSYRNRPLLCNHAVEAFPLAKTSSA